MRAKRDVVISITLKDDKEYLYHVCRGIKYVEMTKAYKESIELLDSNDFVYSIIYKYYEIDSPEIYKDIFDWLEHGNVHEALRYQQVRKDLNLNK